MHRVASAWGAGSFAARATFDLVLAVTLAANGVREFYTRNTDDFVPLGLFTVRNPIDDE